MMRVLLFLMVTTLLTACGPNLARTNARIEKGLFHAGVSGTYSNSLGGTHTKSSPTANSPNKESGQGELDLQFGKRNETTNTGVAIQLKLGVLAAPGVDVYFELPSSDSFYYGVGAEFGVGNGGYLVGTYYLGKAVFLTVTGRALFWSSQGLIINPQLAVGFGPKEGGPTFAIFSGYERAFGDGIKTNYCIFDDKCTEKYADHLVYGGASLRF